MAGTGTWISQVGLALLGALALGLAGCGGDGGADAAAINGYRFRLSMRAQTAGAGLLDLRLTSAGEYMVPDRYHGRCRAALGRLTVAAEEVIAVGVDTWVRDQATGSTFAHKVPVACGAGLAQAMAGSFPVEKLGVGGRRERVDGVDALRYHLDRDDALRLLTTALTAAVPQASIVSLDDLTATANSTVTADIWVSRTGHWPVKLTLTASVGPGDAATSLRLEYEIADVNAKEITIVAP